MFSLIPVEKSTLKMFPSYQYVSQCQGKNSDLYVFFAPIGLNEHDAFRNDIF